MKKVLIAGGSGFVGEHLRRMLISQYYEVYILTTQKSIVDGSHYFYWDPENQIIEIDPCLEFESIINLAGANLASKLWTKNRKREIIDSRVNSTSFISNLIKTNQLKTQHFVQTSAIGIYGDMDAEILSEESVSGHGYLADVCEQWEKALCDLTIPHTILRLGVVYHPKEGAFPKMILGLKFKFLVIFSDGKQYISWIDIDDLCRMYLFSIEHRLNGVFNAVSPQPIPYFFLLRRVQRIFGKISIPIHIPRSIIRFIFNDFSEMLVYSQRVSSKKIEEAGFLFQSNSLKQFLKKNKKKI